MTLAVSLDPKNLVATWGNDAPEHIIPNVLKGMVDPHFRGWRWQGQTDLQTAIRNWHWIQENLGKNFPSSIYLVSKVWIFPVGFEVSQDWESSSLENLYI